MFEAFSRTCLLFLLSTFVSCALPTPDKVSQSFVPDKEVLAASLVKEGLNYFQKSRFVDSEFRMRQALYLFPGTVRILFNLAVALEAQDRSEEALEIYLDLYKGNPKSFRYLTALGRINSKLGRYEEAKAYFLEGRNVARDLTDFQNEASFLRNLAVLAFAVGKEEEALCYSGDAADTTPNDGEIARHAKLLMALNLVGAADRVLSAFTKNATANRSVFVMKEFSYVRFAQANWKEASEFAKEALIKRNDDPELQYEIQVANSAATLKLIETGAEVRKVEASEEDSPEQILSDPRTTGPLTLYWPVNLIEFVEKVHADAASE